MSSTVETTNEIRPFQVDTPEEALEDLRRRIAATRWPSRELVTDRSQGVQLATLQALTSPDLTSTDTTERNAGMLRVPLRGIGPPCSVHCKRYGGGTPDLPAAP